MRLHLLFLPEQSQEKNKMPNSHLLEEIYKAWKQDVQENCAHRASSCAQKKRTKSAREMCVQWNVGHERLKVEIWVAFRSQIMDPPVNTVIYSEANTTVHFHLLFMPTVICFLAPSGNKYFLFSLHSMALVSFHIELHWRPCKTSAYHPKRIDGKPTVWDKTAKQKAATT